LKYLKWLISFSSRTLNLVAVTFLLVSLSSSYISPLKIWFMPFMGMLLPLALALNLFFVISWILRKRYFVFVSMAAIILCIPQMTRLFAFHVKKQKPAPEHTLKILSYNTRDFDLYNWSENTNSKNVIFKTIRDENADVLCFQEYYSDSSAEFNTIKQLQDLGYKHYYFIRELTLRGTDEWGIAIFSKYPMADTGAILKQEHKTGYGRKPYKGMYCDILWRDSIIRVINVHLQSIYFGSRDYETIDELKETQEISKIEAINIIRKLRKAFRRRAKQANDLKIFLEEQKKPFVLCGDFNDLPNSYTANKIAAGLNDAYLQHGFGIGSTYNGNIPFLRIDYIHTSPNLNSYSFRVIHNPISDHFPVTATVGF
jgi:endonuclease/exonuclease/phosphatase family metal-dependent hydrolase